MTAILAGCVGTVSGPAGDEDAVCEPGHNVACYCPDGAQGIQQCAASGDGYLACVCNGSAPSNPGPIGSGPGVNNPDDGTSGGNTDGGNTGGGNTPPDNGGETGTPGGSGPGANFPAAQSFEAEGPFNVNTANNAGPGGDFTLFYPTPLGANGVKHPIITWGNGTGAVPQYYAELLRHFASHGFVVIATNSTQAGSGEEMLEGVYYLLDENSDPGSPFYNMLSGKVGATGHSQGGGGAINAGTDPVVVATAPIQPAPGSVQSLQGPMFLSAGSADTIVSADRLVEPLIFNRASVPTFYGVLDGASHFEPVGDGGRYRGPLTAWFRLQLMGDNTATSLFYGESCELCVSSEWDVKQRQM